MEEKETLNDIISEENALEKQEPENIEVENKEMSEDELGYKEFVESLEAKWYVLHTFSGYENVAKENLETVIEKFNLQDRIFDIIIPMEDVVEEKKGKKVLVQRKAMPSYILVKMKYADDIWHNVTRTRGITGFVGPKGRPLALPPEDVIRLRLEKIKVEVDLAVNDKIEIVDGALNGMIGEVTSINLEMGTASVNVEMFGRETSVEVEISQVRKINN